MRNVQPTEEKVPGFQLAFCICSQRCWYRRRKWIAETMLKLKKAARLSKIEKKSVPHIKKIRKP
jgi:hypothetical protein